MRPWRFTVVGAALLLTGCGVPTTNGVQPLPAELAGLAVGEHPEVALAAPAELTDLAWVHGDGLRLSSRAVSASDTATRASAALAAAIAGPTSAEVARGLSTEIPPDLEASLVVDGGSATIELPAPSPISSNVTLATAQLALAVLLVPGIEQVTFTIGGVPAEVPLPDGTVGSGPVMLSDFTSLLDRRPTP